MAVALTTYEHPRVRKTPTQTTKPFTDDELRARSAAETYFYLARDYATCGDNLNAISCCIEALMSTTGITRPLAVRDEIVELVRVIDPGDHISNGITRCMYAAVNPTRVCTPSAECKHFERLVSAPQLIQYPSTDARFNAAYEKACSQLRHQNLPELYVVVYTSGLCSRLNDQYFAVVPSSMITHRGPYYLTDICAAVRNELSP